MFNDALKEARQNKALLESIRKVLIDSKQLREFTLDKDGNPVYPKDGPKFKVGDTVKINNPNNIGHNKIGKITWHGKIVPVGTYEYEIDDGDLGMHKEEHLEHHILKEFTLDKDGNPVYPEPPKSNKFWKGDRVKFTDINHPSFGQTGLVKFRDADHDNRYWVYVDNGRPVPYIDQAHEHELEHHNP